MSIAIASPFSSTIPRLPCEQADWVKPSALDIQITEKGHQALQLSSDLSLSHFEYYCEFFNSFDNFVSPF